MRIADQNIVSVFLANISRSRERLVQLQGQIATGKRVSQPSDDPRAAALILRLSAGIDRNEQYQSNILDAEGMLESTSTAMENLTGTFTEVKEILTRANNTGNTESLATLADRIDELLAAAVDAANTKFNGKFLFGGTNTLQAPFTLAADRSTVTANPNGITGSVRYEVGEGYLQQVNLDGQEALQGTQFFTMLIQIRDTMRAGTVPSAADSTAVASALDHVLAKGSKAGSMLEHVRVLGPQLEQQKTQLLALLSEQQDTDIAEAVMKLKLEETSLEAALNAGSQIIPKTLVDFLR
jgi:flagellar hook-associated protein 3 FlgL